MFFKDFIKNPQTTIALTFLTHIISGIDGVNPVNLVWFRLRFQIDFGDFEMILVQLCTVSKYYKRRDV